MTHLDRPAGPRRAPVQQRSSLRVNRMLDAAAELMLHGGYAAATTSAVAARAGVSIGSLYQFFPDRDAVLQALARRSFERFTAMVSERLADSVVRSWQRLLDLVIDTYVECSMADPSGRALSLGGVHVRRMLHPDLENTVVVANALGRVLVSVRPDVVLGEELRLALRVAVEAADAVLTSAVSTPEGPDELVVSEVKLLLRVYLARHIPRAGRPTAPH